VNAFLPDPGVIDCGAAKAALSSQQRIAHTHPAWYLNLTAAGEARVEVEDRTLRVRVEQLSPAEAASFWPRVLQEAPDYAHYCQRTDRVIPLLRLVPVDGSVGP